MITTRTARGDSVIPVTHKHKQWWYNITHQGHVSQSGFCESSEFVWDEKSGSKKRTYLHCQCDCILYEPEVFLNKLCLNRVFLWLLLCRWAWRSCLTHHFIFSNSRYQSTYCIKCIHCRYFGNHWNPGSI